MDVGDRRVGIAAATLEAGLARPLTTLRQDEGFPAALEQIVKNENAEALVVGLPRGLDGQVTAQTQAAEAFANDLRERYADLTVYLQDEAVTSKKAEAELEARGKPYQRADIDALAATYILEDWLAERRQKEATG
ncbi:MAG TPA: Holliday junction resolvase RuvX [Candidatus Dormibacteraeota bacterium]|nr:Holliday junction resolvase RuvX [Candidatus Dormibacteraeota bacterium]